MTSVDPAPLTAGLRPPRLCEGDVVALVAPSGPVPPERLDAGIAILREWGLQVRVMPHALRSHPRHSYLAGDDEARAADFCAAWAQPDVRAIFCARGGYGAQRMIDRVDWSALRDAEPTVLVGYSDVTALHQAVASQLGVVTLHGPMPSTADFLDSPAAREHLRTTLFEPERAQVLTHPSARPLIGGAAVGVTTGGCLSVLATSVSTPSSIRAARGGVVMLEDCCEKAYRIDSYLTQLRRSGWFDGAAGVVLGSWADCEPAGPVVAEVLGSLGLPILDDLGFGHGQDPITVPLGMLAELDADAGTLTLERPALA
jgi:muramoyltetrapeptide carboxypeptidase